MPIFIPASDLYYGITEVAQNAAAAVGNGTVIDMQGANQLVVDISGTFVGTVSFECTIDGTNWLPLGMSNIASGALATSATAPGTFAMSTGGVAEVPMQSFRARISAYTSGNITVKTRKASN